MTPYRITEARLYLLPVQTRVPLKFGNETLESVTCARVALRVEDAQGRHATGWGETPISVQWVWPSDLPYAERELALLEYAGKLTLRPAEMTEADADHLKATGLDDGEILEANQIICYFNYVNRSLNGLGVTTDNDVVGYYAKADETDPQN